MQGAPRGLSRLLRVRQRLLRRVSSSISTSTTSSCVSSVSSRNFRSSSACLAGGRRNATDDSEAALAQQMLDFLKLAEEEEAADSANETLSTVQAELPVSGVVMGVQNGLARVSGLRHATIGSVVDVSDASGASLCQGLVLFMEKKVVHVALLSTSDQKSPVKRGMDVQLVREQLEIPGSLQAFAGAVLDPLGRAVQLGEEDQEQEQEQTAKDRVKVTWGAQSVPGLMTRAPLRSPFETGLLAVDCLHPMAHGHRFGVLGPRNSGKTRVALDVIAHQVARAKARKELPPQIVYVCIGKSAARIHQIRDALKTTGALEHTTIIASSDRDSPVLQYLAPFTGCAVAEFLMYNGKSPRSLVVYDDLATHTTVVEGLVQALHLPRAAQISLSAHAVLMERSAQFRGATKKEGGPSLTSLVLVDAPDSQEIPSEFQERVASLVDDYVGLESSLARNRVFPPVDVLAPGASVRGPPFQSATRWTFVSRLRARINAAAQVKQNVEVARKLGFETEPEDAETLEFLELVQQFFTQKPLLSATMPGPEQTAPTELETELGAFFLTIVDMTHLPGSDGVDDAPLNLWEFLHNVVSTLSREENSDIFHQLTTHSRTKAWSIDLQDNVALVLFEELEAIKQRRTQEYKEEQARRKQYLRKLQERKAKTEQTLFVYADGWNSLWMGVAGICCAPGSIDPNSGHCHYPRLTHAVTGILRDCVLWASASGSKTFANSKTTKVISLHATQPIYANLHQVPSARLLRIPETPDEEKRVPVGGILPDLVKRGGQKITDSVRVRFWLQQKSKTADKVFTNLKLDGGLEKAIANKNLNTWFTYVNLYNKKYPQEQDFGDRYVHQDVNTWKEEGKSIDDVFKLLNLDKAGEELLTRLEINTWSVYITRLTGRRPGENAISVLESHYGAAALAKMILTTEPPTGTLRLLAMRLENAMLWRWLGQKKSLDDVFKLLELNGSADKLLTNPVLKTWMGYATLYNAKNPDAQVPMLKTLAKFFDSKEMKVLVAGKKDPKTSALVADLQAGL